jgi:ABC-type antimicrobial peptide transport system permease subunit
VLKQAGVEKIGAGYFAMLNEPMLAGREFTEQDQRSPGDSSAALPAVLNESAARGLFGNGNAVGERLKQDNQSYEVVGVVRDQKIGLADEALGSVLYAPLTQRDFTHPGAGGMTILIRSSAGPDALGGVRKEIAAIDPKLAIFNVQTLSEQLENSRAFMILGLETYGGIGLFGLILAAIGLAGVTAYAVARRRKEIGIRMALGASKAQVLRLVLKEGTVLIAIGSVLGYLAAVGLAKVLKALTSVFVEALNVGTTDLRLLLGAPLLLAALALLACYLPARRAAKIDPLKALRES